MIIDGHAHAWSRWPYLPAVPDEASRGTAEQLLFEMERNGIDSAVVIAAGLEHNEDNNDYVAAAAARYPGRLHHFAEVDCRWSAHYHTAGAADRLNAVADRYQVSGISHYCRPHNDGWLVSDEGMAFFGAAARRGLVVSLAAPPPWHEDLRAVARAYPELPILCHHLAGVHSWPGGVDEGLRMVLASVDDPNIFVKLSGYYSGAQRPWDFPHHHVLPVVRAYYESWGAERLIWSSDFPVCQRKGLTYRQALEVVRSYCSFVRPADLPLLLGENLRLLLAGANQR